MIPMMTHRYLCELPRITTNYQPKKGPFFSQGNFSHRNELPPFISWWCCWWSWRAGPPRHGGGLSGCVCKRLMYRRLKKHVCPQTPTKCVSFCVKMDMNWTSATVKNFHPRWSANLSSGCLVNEPKHPAMLPNESSLESWQKNQFNTSKKDPFFEI